PLWPRSGSQYTAAAAAANMKFLRMYVCFLLSFWSHFIDGAAAADPNAMSIIREKRNKNFIRFGRNLVDYQDIDVTSKRSDYLPVSLIPIPRVGRGPVAAIGF
ncbi:unnamed protein product, partial [Meganyctiphanes norvegica]